MAALTMMIDVVVDTYLFDTSIQMAYMAAVAVIPSIIEHLENDGVDW